jgi:transcriptional regulator with XRE-family HTH domain
MGDKIRARRTALGLSLRAVSSETDISPSFLAQIERQEADPSLETLQSIAHVLRVPMLYFFTEELDPERVVHPQNRRHLHFQASNVTYELLAPDLSRNSMGLVMRVGPGVHIKPIHLAEPTEEWLLVLEGVVEITLNSEVYRLQTGDSIYYEGWEFHGLTATGRKEAVLIGNMTPSAF